MRLYSHMSEEQSPPGYRTSCARAGPSGSSPKSTQKSGFNLTPPFTVSTSTLSNMLQSIISTSVNLERTAVLEWWPLNECFMRK